MRKLIVSLLILVALLAVADRVGVWAAQRDVAKRLQASAQLSTAPTVEIHGFPFLTQLIGGDYHDVDIRMTGLHGGGLRIDRLSVHVQGAHVSIGDVLSQNRSRIRIDHASAELRLTYADIAASVVGQVGSTPGRFDHSIVTSASVSGGDTVVLHTATVDVPVKLTGLPFGIRLISAKATTAGIEVSGQASGLVLRT
jgi:hypothetical protein